MTLATTVQIIPNIFDRGTREISTEAPGCRVLSYLPDRRWLDGELVIVRNGGMLSIEEAEDQFAKEGDELIFSRVPTGLGAASVAVSATVASTGGLTLGQTLVLGLVLNAVSFGVNYAVAQANKISRPRFGDTDALAFTGFANGTNPGNVRPIIYGVHRTGGQRISQTIRDPDLVATLADFDFSNGVISSLLSPCLGEISGLSEFEVDGNTATELSKIVFTSRTGALDQAPIPGYGEQRVQTTYDQEITFSGGSAQFTTADEVDQFGIVFAMPQGIGRVSSKGRFKPIEMEILVEYRKVGITEWTVAFTAKVRHKTAASFQFFRRSPVLERADYEIRITRQTGDDSTARAETRVFAITDIVNREQSYPGLALYAVDQLPTRQFNGAAPEYTTKVTGRLVRVYSSPTSFVTQFSDIPAWCLLDLFLDRENGIGGLAGNVISPTHPMWTLFVNSLVTWAAFTETSVDINGGAGSQRRAFLNMIVDGTLTAEELVKQICAIGFGFFVRRGSSFVVVPDRDDPPIQLFTTGRTSPNNFQKTKVEQQNAPNVYIGSYFDADLNWTFTSHRRPDPTKAPTDPEIPENVSLLGATDIHQVDRLLLRAVKGRRLNRDLISMEVHLWALTVEAGDVVAVANEIPQIGFGGQLKQVYTMGTKLALDREVTLEASKSYEITVAFPDGTFETVAVTNPTETTNVLTTGGGWTLEPVAGDEYSFAEVAKTFQKYRVSEIAEVGGDPLKRRVVLTQMDPGVYTESSDVLPTPTASSLPDPFKIPPNATDLVLVERAQYTEDGRIIDVLDVNFQLPASAGISADIYIRDVVAGESRAWERVGNSTGAVFSITDNIETPGVTYEISVVSLSKFGMGRHPDDATKAQITTTGSTRQPANVTGFSIDRTSINGLVLTWDDNDPLVDFDLLDYEIRFGDEWEVSQRVARVVDNEYRTDAAVSGAVKYLVKARNTVGNYSITAIAVSITIPASFNENIVLTRSEETAWTGAKTGDVPPVINGSLLKFAGGDGTYTTGKFDVGSDALRCVVSGIIKATFADLTLTWDSESAETWDGAFASTQTWDGDPTKDIPILLEWRFSILTSADGDFGAWKERPQSFDENLKHAQARVSVTIDDSNVEINLSEMTLVFDVPDVHDSGSTSTNSGALKTVSFNRTYNAIPKVQATINGVTAGDDLDIQNETKTGFDVGVLNGGSYQAGITVNWQAIGH